MRLTLLVLILTAIISGCSSTSSSGLDFSLDGLSLNEEQKKQFKELDTLLANDVETRNLLRAKHLAQELKSSVPDDHSRYIELVKTEQWIIESLDYRKTIELLQSKIAKQNKALEQVRRTLVSE